MPRVREQRSPRRACTVPRLPSASASSSAPLRRRASARMDEAIALYQEVQRRFPRNAEAFVRAADLVRNFKGDTSGAIELLRTAAGARVREDAVPGPGADLREAVRRGRRGHRALRRSPSGARGPPGPDDGERVPGARSVLRSRRRAGRLPPVSRSRASCCRRIFVATRWTRRRRSFGGRSVRPSCRSSIAGTRT